MYVGTTHWAACPCVLRLIWILMHIACSYCVMGGGLCIQPHNVMSHKRQRMVGGLWVEGGCGCQRRALASMVVPSTAGCCVWVCCARVLGMLLLYCSRLRHRGCVGLSYVRSRPTGRGLQGRANTAVSLPRQAELPVISLSYCGTGEPGCTRDCST